MEVFDHAYDDYQESLEKRCKNCNGVVFFNDADYCCGNCEKQDNRWK